MTQADLAEFQSEWIEPISTNYHGYDVFELPPPGQGFAALEMLNILEVCVPKLGINLAALGPSNPMYWHLHGRSEEARLLRSAGEERRSEVRRRAGRASCCRRRYAATLCGKINPNVAAKPGVDRRHRRRHDLSDDRRSLGQHGVARSTACSASTAAAPPSRRTASCCTTAARRSRSIPKSPNIVAPHKRPFHTIIAGFVMKDGQPLMTFGNMGGSVQPETHAQHMVNLIDLGMNVQMTTDAARFTHNQSSNVLSLETNLFNLVGAALQGEGTRGASGQRRRRSAAIRASCSRAIRGCRSRLRRARRRRGSAGERRLSRRIGSPQGRSGGRLVRRS